MNLEYHEKIIGLGPECDCEPEGHVCGWPKYKRETELLRHALDQVEPRDPIILADATGPQTSRGISEPGDLIATGDCPICGSEITVELGDDPGEIVFLAHSNQQGRKPRAKE